MVGLEYIHSMGVLHRDLKPENIVFDFKGYPKITDFGISRFTGTDNGSDSSGTAGYVSPEVLALQNHGPAADCFALGVICFEMLMGHRPYSGKNRQEFKNEVMAFQAEIKEKDLTYAKLSPEGVDFINSLLIRKPKHRLGGQAGVKDLKAHPWFREFPWKELEDYEVRPPFKPKFVEKDITYGERTDPDKEVIPNQTWQGLPESHDPFADFYYHPILFSDAADSPSRKHPTRHSPKRLHLPLLKVRSFHAY